MKCQNCGGYIKRRDTYCPHCGETLKSSPNKSQYRKENSNFNSRPKKKNSDYKPISKKKNTEYKPLQKRFIRGEYQDQEDDFYNQYIEEQFIEEKPTYQKPKKKKYRGYDLSEYYPEEEESPGMGMLPIILILFIALLLGFIIGIMVFSNSPLPSIG